MVVNVNDVANNNVNFITGVNQLWGYARVSTKDQDLERQLVKFHALGIPKDNIKSDKQSGKNFDREQYQEMKVRVRRGDLIYFDALDRLGRDYDGIIREWKYFTREVGADIVVLENESLFDSRIWKKAGDIGKLMEDQFLSLLAFVADQQRKKMLTNQAEAYAVGKAKGIKYGRPKLEVTRGFVKAYTEWKDGVRSATETWQMLDISKTSFYKLVQEYEDTLPLEGVKSE